MIALAKHSEIPEIVALTRACGKHLLAHGIKQWDENYPNQAAFETDIDHNKLYVLKNELPRCKHTRYRNKITRNDASIGEFNPLAIALRLKIRS